MSGELTYEDTVAALFAEGYDLTEITVAAVVHRALDHWIAAQAEFRVGHHAACYGTGHQRDDNCEGQMSIYGLMESLHADSWRFIRDLLAAQRPGEPQQETGR